MEIKRSYTNSAWHLIMSAALSVVFVAGTLVWYLRSIAQENNSDPYAAAQTAETFTQRPEAAHELAASLGIASPGTASSTPDQIAQLGSTTISHLVNTYTALSRQNAYTPQIGARIAASAAAGLKVDVPYTMYDPSSIPTKPDTSYDAIIAYRKALQQAFAPMKKNTHYELELYDAYMHTRDANTLMQLQSAAQSYLDATALASKVTVPADAVPVQVGILNAMQEFGTTLSIIIDNVNNPVTSLALLRSYNKAESDMLISFSALNAYYASKKP